MARRIVSITTLTPTAYADTTNIGNGNSFPFLLQGGTATQYNLIWEISLNGQAQSSSSPTYMILGRDSTVCATNTVTGGQTDAALDPATAALAAIPLTGNSNVTLPQRSASLHLANMSLNAFGGVYFWRANRKEECFVVLGNTASFGEASVSAFSGGVPGLIGAHMIYEPL